MKRGYEMKSIKPIKRAAVLLLVLMLAALAMGCKKKGGDVTNVTPVTDAPSTGKDDTQPTTAPTEAPTPTAAPTDEPAKPTAEPTPEPVTDDDLPEGRDTTITVSSIEELVEAVAPEAVIVIEPGRYNMTDFLSRFDSADSIKAWNDAHDYAMIEDVYDGLEIVFENVYGLSISGKDQVTANTEIVTDPRYAAVMTFKNCSDLGLSFMTMGHTDRGDCSGNVLDLIGCDGVILVGLDLYGCGVYGIGASEGTANLIVTETTLRDCANGPFEIYEPQGEFVFSDCLLTGSSWGGYFDQNFNSSLSFIHCTFGDGETNTWAFADHVYFEDCTFGEITSYPEYPDIEDDWDYEPPALDLDEVRVIPAAREQIAGTGWETLYRMDVITDQIYYVGMGSSEYRDISFSFYTDEYLYGEGWYCLDGDYYELKWDITEDGVVKIIDEQGVGTVFAMLYENPNADGTVPSHWLRIAIGEETFWLY